MDRKDPVFITRTETFVAEDKIRPYGSWIGDFSNERLKKRYQECGMISMQIEL